jgi:hypothetical protein
MDREIDPEKLLTMIRSILPSTAPHRARLSKRSENRSVRREVRVALHNDDPETTRRDVRRDSDHSVAVMWRRGADKLNHFMRWCESLTEGMSRQEKLDYVRGILPRNVIGDHAYSHWETHLRPHHGLYGNDVSYRERQRRSAQSAYDSLRCHVRRLLEVQPEVLGELNAAIKRGKEAREPRRLLFGIHDVDAFARDLLKSDHAKERAVVERYLERGRPSGRPCHLRSPLQSLA